MKRDPTAMTPNRLPGTLETGDWKHELELNYRSSVVTRRSSRL